MRLDDYLKEKKLSQAAFGALMQPPVTQSLVSQWIRGTARVMLDQALQIEAITQGAVSPKELSDMYRSREVGTEQPAAA